MTYVSLPTGNVMDLYKTISWEMGLSVERSRAALYRQIKPKSPAYAPTPAVAPSSWSMKPHHLRPDVLEDLRLLTNYQMDAEHRLCLVLVGHPKLRRRLTMACTGPSRNASSSATTWPRSPARNPPRTLRTGCA